MRISVELVPRNEQQVLADAQTVRSVFPEADTCNIPDLIRFPLRSWEACGVSRQVIPASIPHVRAIDFPVEDISELVEALSARKLPEVLVVRGDMPQDLSRRVYPNTSVNVIRRLKRALPGLTVYAAYDPYRLGFREELEGVARKVEAGADGFFTQPVFDLRLLEMCAEMLPAAPVFWGVAPVLGEKSRAYWESTNRIVFPREFTPTLEWNREFARRAIGMVRALGANVYLMPIRVDLASYLGGLLG